MTVGLLLALAAVLVLLELLRSDRRHRSLRIGALTTALAGFAWLLVARVAEAPAGRLTILAPGTPAGVEGGFRLDDMAVPSPRSLATLGALGDSLTEARAITLRGWGLLPHEWAAMPAVPVSFMAEALPSGVVALEAPRQIGLGELFTVRGRVHLPGPEAGWVRLVRDTMVLDSAPVSSAADSFTLHDRPRVPGTVEYALVLEAPGGDQREVLGVGVVERPLPRVLILEGSPSFETGFLKRWLGGRGGRLSIRTQLSRDRFRSERVNGPGPSLTPLTAEGLGQFDLIVADGPALAGGSRGELELIRQAVLQDGVGLLVVPGVAPALAALRPLLPATELQPRGDEPFRLSRPRWPEQGRRPPVGVSIEAGVLVARGAEPLVEDDAGAPLAIRRSAGRGAAGLTLVAAPSRWMLDGDRDLYGGYWSHLFSAIARDTAAWIALRSDGPLRPGRGMTLILLTGDTLPRLTVRSAAGGAERIPLERDPLDPRRWSGPYWPREAGWHSAETGAGRALPFRVSAPGEWLGLEAAARLEATQFHLGAERGTATTRAATGTRAASLPGFLLVLLGASVLWYEHRRRA